MSFDWLLYLIVVLVGTVVSLVLLFVLLVLGKYIYQYIRYGKIDQPGAKLPPITPDDERYGQIQDRLHIMEERLDRIEREVLP